MDSANSRCSWRLLAALVAVLSGLLLAGAPAARATVGPRVTIGMFGDSVTESYTIPHYLRDGLVPQVRAALAKVPGLEAGGTGLIPASAFRWRYSKYVVAGKAGPRPDAWVLSGFAGHGGDGPSGYSALAYSPNVTATAPIDAPLIGVLFTKFQGAGVFTVTAGSQTFSIDAGSTGPPTPSEQFIVAPPDARTITVHGPNSGTLIFNGVIVRAPVTPGHIGVEVENLGHMGHRLVEDSAPRILSSIVEQRFDISVFLSAYIWEFAAAGGTSKYENGYANELRSRIQLTRSYGGICLVVDPSPLPLVLGSVIGRFAAIDRQIAHQFGCAYFAGLAHLWNPATAVKNGITLIDDVHPRAPGYRLMGQALAPVLARLVRQRVRTRGF